MLELYQVNFAKRPPPNELDWYETLGPNLRNLLPLFIDLMFISQQIYFWLKMFLFWIISHRCIWPFRDFRILLTLWGLLPFIFCWVTTSMKTRVSRALGKEILILYSIGVKSLHCFWLFQFGCHVSKFSLLFELQFIGIRLLWWWIWSLRSFGCFHFRKFGWLCSVLVDYGMSVLRRFPLRRGDYLHLNLVHILPKYVDNFRVLSNIDWGLTFLILDVEFWIESQEISKDVSISILRSIMTRSISVCVCCVDTSFSFEENLRGV